MGNLWLLHRVYIGREGELHYSGDERGTKPGGNGYFHRTRRTRCCVNDFDEQVRLKER